MRFGDDRPSGNTLRLRVAEQTPAARQGAGDTRLAVRLRYGNGRDQTFFAKTHAWVSADMLKTFVAQLADLERHRRGSATLASMSPGELELVVEIVDAAGHTRARGQVGYPICGAGHEPLWASVPFAIRFDPSDLAPLAREFRELTRST